MMKRIAWYWVRLRYRRRLREAAVMWDRLTTAQKYDVVYRTLTGT